MPDPEHPASKPGTPDEAPDARPTAQPTSPAPRRWPRSRPRPRPPPRSRPTPADAGPKVVRPRATTSRKVADRAASTPPTAATDGDRTARRRHRPAAVPREPRHRRPCRRPMSRPPAPRKPPDVVYINQGGADEVTATNVDVNHGGIASSQRRRHRGLAGRHRLARGERVSRRARRDRGGVRRRGPADPGRRRARSSPARCASSRRSSGP